MNIKNISKYIDNFLKDFLYLSVKKMLQYLHSDATFLSAEDIQNIIKAKNSMKQASEAMANKYKISSW